MVVVLRIRVRLVEQIRVTVYVLIVYESHKYYPYKHKYMKSSLLFWYVLLDRSTFIMRTSGKSEFTTVISDFLEKRVFNKGETVAIKNSAHREQFKSRSDWRISTVVSDFLAANCSFCYFH